MSMHRLYNVLKCESQHAKYISIEVMRSRHPGGHDSILGRGHHSIPNPKNTFFLGKSPDFITHRFASSGSSDPKWVREKWPLVFFSGKKTSHLELGVFSSCICHNGPHRFASILITPKWVPCTEATSPTWRTESHRLKRCWLLGGYVSSQDNHWMTPCLKQPKEKHTKKTGAWWREIEGLSWFRPYQFRMPWKPPTCWHFGAMKLPASRIIALSKRRIDRFTLWITIFWNRKHRMCIYMQIFIYEIHIIHICE